ncbi:MAG TPA: heme-binding protein, partial [Verrucomicrobiae bacterium]|nr:heme-binding protein [Verrucomicrobiae bacterium]
MQVLRLACAGFLASALLASAAGTPPIVRMLVPGFKVEALPLHLSNLNNLRFAPDGRLFALAYDGRIHILRDTDGDGLEDSDELYWDRPGLSVPVGMALAPEGVYVSSHGKVSLLKDTNHDGRADVEQIIASNWPPTDVASGGVDATAVTLDKNGNLFFGLIAADYSNPYRVKNGVSHYDLNSKRGTIQELRRGAKESVSVVNGIRVPYALAFNRAGDLFCTDQEGETWCPNGNPLDELNQIIPGRNYGFPPPDEKWLPGLKSEPPVVGFAPQHESACGLIFNDPKPGQGLFGPRWWRGDAFVAGESRGKIWRVRLVKTSHGYVGRPFLIARLSMLTLDLAISPRGALYVCCHSGQPDWGTGPKGEGKIFKITYVNSRAPQPVLAWASDYTDVHIAFDRSVDSAFTRDLPGKNIEFGEFVAAADRFEKLKPPYKVVTTQQAS